MMSKITVTIQRQEEYPTGEGTPGKLVTSDGGFSCDTLELPDHDNHPNLSRIPAGSYVCTYTLSPHLSEIAGHDVWTYEILDMPGRSGERLHSGNFAGDVALHWQSDVLGCVLLGKEGEGTNRFGVGQRGVFDSRNTVKAFVDYLGVPDPDPKVIGGVLYPDFTLVILDPP